MKMWLVVVYQKITLLGHLAQVVFMATTLIYISASALQFSPLIFNKSIALLNIYFPTLEYSRTYPHFIMMLHDFLFLSVGLLIFYRCETPKCIGHWKLKDTQVLAAPTIHSIFIEKYKTFLETQGLSSPLKRSNSLE